MDISSSDIRNRSFSQSLRGLEAEEVYAFLERVADRWDDMTRRTQELQERVHTLQAKLGEIGDTAGKAQKAKERARELQEEMESRERRLEERERELEEVQERLEAREAELRQTVQRVQEVLREETRALSSLDPENGTALEDEEPADASLAGAEAGQEKERPSGERDAHPGNDKSSKQWVDSLFPNRLPQNQADAVSTSDETTADDATDAGDLSASESQFEAIKEDVQGMEQDGAARAPSSGESVEDGSPPTEEMDQIWDVFDDQDQS